ncbi:serine/threonine-protein kinase [Rhodohalobacter sp.]|uniref:serine/threonine-protein kinase n=1 Tax=Rhodohalobacter sp. TaxID=1974210 RepID=UPI002ACEF01B|nr:protein kinase [Rhodohalobacter sp.]MDZ7755776.1 protein kinase [Rhodohalobacter sp.]
MESNTQFANRYQLIERIGIGGFSEVWKAYDQMAENATVAIKIYAPDKGMDQHGLKQFRREYAVVLNLNHPVLLTARHFDVWEGRPYLVMPFIEGGSLQGRLIEKGAMNEDELAKLLAQISSGLQYLHSKDILHQDIKPDNILIDGKGSYLLTDFGISGRLRSTLRKHTGSSKSMTVAYAPPERFTANPENIEASDIFSLGVLAYELATGDVPWMGNGGISLNSGADVPELPDHFSKRFRNLIKQMMSTDPASRPKAGNLKKITEKYLESGHWPEIKVKKVLPKGQSGGRKTQKIETPQPQQKNASGSAATKKGIQTPKNVKRSKSDDGKKKVWLIAAVVLIAFLSAGAFYAMSNSDAEAQRLAELEANQQAVADLVQQADSVKADDDLQGAIGYYEQALEIMPEDENVNRLLTETQAEIDRREEEAAQIAAAEAERQEELDEQREREEAERLRREEEERQRELEERRSRPDITVAPLQGTITLESGFSPDPWPHSVQLSSNIDLENFNYFGFTTSPATVHLEYSAGTYPLYISAGAENDLVMLVYGPDEQWYFNDDFAGFNPGVEFEAPESGTYMIWVGSYEQAAGSALVNISEVPYEEEEDDDIYVDSDDGPDIGAEPIGGDISLEAGFSPDPYTQSITLSGSYDLSEMGYTGMVTTEPTFDLYYTPGSYPLTIKAESDMDTVILINTPGGEWIYNDDFDGANPGVVFENPEDGLYNIWIGTYGIEIGSATLTITEI